MKRGVKMNNVKKLREGKGYQQKELAIMVGVAQPTISEWEHGKKDPSGDRLRKLSEIFGVNPWEILGYETPQENKKEPADRPAPTKKEIMFALFKGTEGITDEDFEDVLRYAEFIKSKKHK